MALTLKPLSLSSGFVLSEFASEFGPGASAHRFTKTQSECHWALAHGCHCDHNRRLRNSLADAAGYLLFFTRLKWLTASATGMSILRTP